MNTLRKIWRPTNQAGKKRLRRQNETDQINTLEVLEPRILLSGVTVITHGYTPGGGARPFWLDLMASAIVSRAGSDTAVYALRVNQTGPDAPYVQSFTQLSGQAPSGTASSNGEAVVLLDWANASDIVSFTSTAAVAQLVTPYLLTANSGLGIYAPLGQSPIHLIGHSRGGSLISELARNLASAGVWVDELTPLDPRPVFSDPSVQAYANVVFADDYYQTADLITGDPLTGAYNVNVTSVVPSHNSIVTYYLGTIPPDGNVLLNGVDLNWYNAPGTGPRLNIGFNFGHIVNVARPASGVGTGWGGTAERVNAPRSGAQWSNVGSLQTLDGRSSYALGEQVGVSYRYQDYDSASTVSWFLDTDRNPYDHNERVFANDQSVAATGASIGTGTVYGSTAGATAGTYYLMARITDGTTTRYAYLPGTVSLSAPSAAVEQAVLGDANGDGKKDLIRIDPLARWWVTTGQNNEQLWGSWSAALRWSDVRVGDLNDDGKTDVLARANTGAWWAGISNGTSFTPQLWGTWATSVTWVDVQSADFNGDGKDDILGRTTAGAWWAGISSGAAFTNAFLGVWSSAATWLDVRTGDFNGDGKDDVFGRTSGGAWWVGVSNGTTITNIFVGTWSPTLRWNDVRIVDFNNDGKDDILGRSNTGAWWVGVSNGTTIINRLVGAWSASIAWRDVQVADFNGDGNVDVIGRTPAGAWWVGLSNGATLTNRYVGAWSSAVTWELVRIGDITGDGKADVLGRVAGTSSWWAGLSNGSTFTNVLWL